MEKPLSALHSLKELDHRLTQWKMAAQCCLLARQRTAQLAAAEAFDARRAINRIRKRSDKKTIGNDQQRSATIAKK